MHHPSAPPRTQHSTVFCVNSDLSKGGFLPVTRVFDILHEVQVLGHSVPQVPEIAQTIKSTAFSRTNEAFAAEVQGLGKPISQLKARNKNNFLCSFDLSYLLAKKQDKQNNKQFTREAKVAPAKAISITFRPI